MCPSADSASTYADASPFTRLLETKSRVRMIDTFLGKSYDELTREEIAELAGIDQSSVSRNLGILLDIGLVKETGTRGNATTFTLNSEHPVAESLKSARRELFQHSSLIESDSVEDELPFDPKGVQVDSQETDPRHLRDSVSSPLEDTDA